MRFARFNLLLAVILTLTFSTVAAQTYVVKKGDCFSDIAKMFQISEKELLGCNPGIKNNPDSIKEGQAIEIPNTHTLSELEKRVVELVNKERSNRGLTTLKHNGEVSRVARIKSQEMVDKGYFSHTSPTYGSPFNMMETFGIKFTAGGENIAKGQPSAEQVMHSWMNSSGHRANILSAVYNEIGVGTAKDRNGNLTWTQLFIKSK